MGGARIVTIPPGTASGDICTDLGTFIVDDAILESDETFSIQIQSVSPCGVIGTESITTVGITDNDSENFLVW